MHYNMYQTSMVTKTIEKKKKILISFGNESWVFTLTGQCTNMTVYYSRQLLVSSFALCSMLRQNLHFCPEIDPASGA